MLILLILKNYVYTLDFVALFFLDTSDLAFYYQTMTTKRLYAIRGAVCVENTADSIISGVKQLYEQILEKNNFKTEDAVSIQFTITQDLTKLNPAAALRKSGYGSDIPLFCSQEPQIEGMLEKVIRILITVYQEKKPVAVYLNGAEILRPDLKK